jgi:hydrogenase expression/formation protein HypE
MTTLPVGKLPGELLQGLLAEITLGDDVIVGPGIGRDAAAVRLGEHILVIKTDPVTFPTNAPGWYLVNVNANDIACMGADPRWLLVTALLPENATTPELATSIFEELRESCEAIGCELIGGHTEITEGLDRPILVGQMIGITSEDRLVDPTTAEPGDAVILIGGIAVEGTSILASEAREQLEEGVDDRLLARASEFARSPGISVVRYASRLLECPEITIKAMHDPTEGGLATGLYEIAEATGLGICIDAETVYVHPETTAITAALGLDPWGLIASGALLAVVPANEVDAARRALQSIEVPVHQIGTLTQDSEQRSLSVNGAQRPIPTFDVDEIARFFASS